MPAVFFGVGFCAAAKPQRGVTIPCAYAATTTKPATHCNAPRVLASQQRLRVLNDGPEDTHQRLRKLVVQVVLRVDRDVVLEHVDGILCLAVCGGALLSLNDDVRHTVTHRRRRACITLLHAGSQLNVGLLGLVVVRVGRLAQRLGDHKQRDVQLVAQQE